MESVRETQKKYCSRAMITAVFAGFFFILAGYKPIGKGIILGAFFSIINFILIGETLPGRIMSEKKRAFFLSLGSILVRYTLLAVPLLLAIKLESYNLFAVIAGIFMIQFIIIVEQFAVLLSSTLKKR
ncbi:Putative ATP synthase, protein I [Desulfonema limicola]|uniref:ATP synthase, protein I n=1 Tax=Desulfonema limicola TaxID=45656 RepID=A0A975B3M2_9BACT|nr:ATP synthase subunit I [Desulfonema limicola]QTA78173.1 Putative ATP synthase, protein I [Desulfonema limicola]